MTGQGSDQPRNGSAPAILKLSSPGRSKIRYSGQGPGIFTDCPQLSLSVLPQQQHRAAQYEQHGEQGQQLQIDFQRRRHGLLPSMR